MKKKFENIPNLIEFAPESKTELYIMKKLLKLSEVEKIFLADMLESLGDWNTVDGVAKYFCKSKKAIYRRIYNEELITRNLGTRVLVYTKSLICLLEKRK